MIIISLVFGDNVKKNQRQFEAPLLFCILFAAPLNKANLSLATQKKILF